MSEELFNRILGEIRVYSKMCGRNPANDQLEVTCEYLNRLQADGRIGNADMFRRKLIEMGFHDTASLIIYTHRNDNIIPWIS